MGEGGTAHSNNLRGHDALGRDVTLKGIDLAVLGVAKVIDFYDSQWGLGHDRGNPPSINS